MKRASKEINLSEPKWHSMPLIDEMEKSDQENSTLKRGTSTMIERNVSICQTHGARSLEDMLAGQSTFPAMLLPTAVVKRSSLCIYEADKPTTVTVNSKGVELQEVTLRSQNEKSLGIIIEMKIKRNGKATKHEIYIKQFHQKGKAFLDGRLKKGDRIIKVNGVIIGEAVLAHFCGMQVWTFTIARSVVKAKSQPGTGLACGIPKIIEPQDEEQQILCNKFLEGVNKKHLYKEIRTASKKRNWWDRVSTVSMVFEDLVMRSDSYINIKGDGERVDVKQIVQRSIYPTERMDSKQVQMFYPQRRLYVFEPITETTPQTSLFTTSC